MNQFSPLVLLLLIDTAILTYIGIYAMNRRQVKGGIHFGGLMLAAAFWSAASAHEMVAYGADAKVMFSQLSYLGIVFVGWLWLIFAMEYTQVRRNIIKTAKVALFPIPFVVLILVFGNDYFGAIWPRTYQLILDGYAPVIYEHGWAFYANTAIIYAEVLVGIILMLAYGIKRYSKKDNGPLLMAIAISITWVANFLYVFIGTRYAGYDVTPLVLGITGIVIFYGVFRSRLFDQLPTAKDVAFHIIDSGMVIINKDKVVLEINAMGRKLLHEDIKPGTILTNTNVGADKVLKHQVAVLLGKAKDTEFYCERLEKWIEVRSYDVGKDKNANEGKLFFFNDITKQRELYVELHNSKEFFSSIVDFLPEPTFVVDATGKIVIWNKAIAEMMSAPATKMIGKGDFAHAEVFYGKKRPMLIDLMINDPRATVDIYDNLTKHGDQVSTVLEKDGYYLWCIAKPLYDVDGKITGAIESIRNVTDQKKTEIELQERLDTLLKLNDILVKRESKMTENFDAHVPTRKTRK